MSFIFYISWYPLPVIIMANRLETGFRCLTYPPVAPDECSAEAAFGRDESEAVQEYYEGVFAVGRGEGEDG